MPTVSYTTQDLQAAPSTTLGTKNMSVSLPPSVFENIDVNTSYYFQQYVRDGELLRNDAYCFTDGFD